MAKKPTKAQLVSYEDKYSDSGFKKVMKKVAKKVAKPALTLYYVMKDPDTPTAKKTLIVGALGYLICPVDLIPDFIPVVGFTDDLAALAAVLAAVSSCVTDKIRKKVDDTLGN